MNTEFSILRGISFPAVSTTVKCVQPVASRKHIEDSQPTRGVHLEPNFPNKHLSKIPDDIDWKKSVDYKLLESSKTRSPPGGEKSYYTPFSSFLTKISNYIYGNHSLLANVVLYADNL